jgi:hypothetical protein
MLSHHEIKVVVADAFAVPGRDRTSRLLYAAVQGYVVNAQQTGLAVRWSGRWYAQAEFGASSG